MPLGIPIPDIGAISKHFSDKCFRAIEENIRIVLEKLANPKDLFTFEVSGALVDSVDQVMSGGLDAFKQDFVQETATRAAVQAVDAVGAEYPDLTENIQKTINTAFNIINFAFLANNGLVLFMMKIVARNIINQLDSKASRTAALKDYLTQLHNILLTMKNGEPGVYDEYLDVLRSALIDVIQAETRVQLVQSTLQSSSIYLSRPYEDAKGFVASALMKVKPTETNPLIAPFTRPDGAFGGGDRPYAKVGATLLDVAGLPSTGEQVDNMLQVPAMTEAIVTAIRDYGGIVASINGMLRNFSQGLNALETTLYDSVQKYARDHLQRILNDLGYTKNSMDNVLSQRSPNPAKVTTKSFEWAIRLSNTLALMKVLPSDILGKINAPVAEVAFYESTIEQLKRLDTIGTGQAVLIAEDAREDVGALETQLLPLLLQANAKVFTLGIDDSLLSLNKNLIKRMDLTISRDAEIRAILQAFVDYPLALEDELNNAINAVNDLLSKAGLDRALDLINTGDLASFFDMNPKTASYVGAALNGLAFLKDCFDTEEEREKYNEVQDELESDTDLLNVQIGFNLDLRFFQNLEECLRVEGLVKMFELDEYLCGLAEEAGIGKIFESLNDVVKF